MGRGRGRRIRSAERGEARRLDGRRVLDLTLGSIGLAVSLPVLGLTALAMRLTGDSGPFLYRARRVGAGGTPLTVLKIRTMYREAGGSGLTTADDPRVTRVGRVIRRYRIDELPQLVNVIRGEMSLVGPRPEDPRFVDHDDPLHRRVFAAKPGITGPTQIRFRQEGTILAAATDPDRLYREVILPRKLAMDAAYLEVRTVRSDIAVIVRTVLALLPGRSGRADEDHDPGS